MKIPRSSFDALVRVGLYPLLAAATVAYIVFEVRGSPHGTPGRYYGAYLAGLVIVMVSIEQLHALKRAWRMTWPLLWRRDVPYLALGAGTMAAANYGAMVFLTNHAWGQPGALRNMPLVPGVVLSILITDFLWYWVHRISHEASGPVGRFLWRVHVAHHLPQQVYVFMHAIGHPLNLLLVRAILTIPPYLLGLSPEVAFVASVVTGFQGMVSHFNVDSRAGWVNHVLMGTELHRYHHSAEVSEAGNYGAVVSVWDKLFGTFVYRPGVAPQRLGVAEPQAYPRDVQILSVLHWPFHRSGACEVPRSAAGSASG